MRFEQHREGFVPALRGAIRGVNFRYCRWSSLVLLSTIGAPALAAGQVNARIGGGLALSMTPNLAEGFSTDQICPHRSAIGASARATVALTAIIQFEALGEVFRGPGNDCVDGLIPPPPPSGPYTRSFDYYDERITDPPAVVSLRVGGTLVGSGAFTLRPYVGIAWLARKGITTPQAGFSVGGGRGRLRLLLEVEGWWYSVPQLHLEEEFFDGQMIRRSVTAHGVRAFTTIFRLGFTSSVGRS
jgi:hypothetical protein